ncbi:hypothetical protein Tco_1329124 [Tanacetum coccineum]
MKRWKLQCVIPVNVNEEEEEITDEVYELKRREKGKIVEESRSTPFPTQIRTPRFNDLVYSDTKKHPRIERLLLERQQNKEETNKMIAKAMLQERGKLQAEISLQIQQAIDINIPSLVDASIVARRANECIVSITEPDYKNLNKNDIEDMYLLIINGKVPDYTETGTEKHEMFSIIYEPVHGIIYKNFKKEKRVMRHSKIHKFCDATIHRVLEGLKSYNNDVKYGYIQRDLNKDEVEYLKLFEEEIEVRLKYHN